MKTEKKFTPRNFVFIENKKNRKEQKINLVQ